MINAKDEKIFVELFEFLAEHEDEISSPEDERKLIDRFLAEHPIVEHMKANEERLANPQTSDDYYTLAENATTKKKKIEYLNKSLELDPDNLYSGMMLALLTMKDPVDYLEHLSALLAKGEILMEKGNYFQEHTGDFWTVQETRPFMRLLHGYMLMLISCNMINAAIEKAKELLKLCENDNLGVRYTLIHLYAKIEDEYAALMLHRRYGGMEEAQMLLPLAVLYFKKYELNRSLEYLQRLCKINKNTKKFIKAVKNSDLDSYRSEEMNFFVYQSGTIQELITEYDENGFLFDDVPFFFEWADRALRKKRKPKNEDE